MQPACTVHIKIFWITSVRLELVLTSSQVQGNTKRSLHTVVSLHQNFFQCYQYKQTSRVNLLHWGWPQKNKLPFFNLPLLFSYSFILDCDLARFHMLTEVRLGHWLDMRSKSLQSGSFPWVVIKGGFATKSFSWGLNFQELGSVVFEGFDVDSLPGQSWTVIRAWG